MASARARWVAGGPAVSAPPSMASCAEPPTLAALCQQKIESVFVEQLTYLDQFLLQVCYLLHEVRYLRYVAQQSHHHVVCSLEIPDPTRSKRPRRVARVAGG